MKKTTRAEPSWSTRLTKTIAGLNVNDDDAPYAQANSDSVQRAVRGMGPDSKKVDSAAGARMVVNLSSVHVPAFCHAATTGDPRPYKNCYDLALIGEEKVSRNRSTVDDALPLPPGLETKDVYFGAVELSGPGIRFYGDVCLVLRRDAVDGATTLLDRNSYDLVRAPVKDVIAKATDRPATRKRIARSWRGDWGRDIGHMAAIKALMAIPIRGRRWTVGQISEAVREDEDYIEVLKANSFGPAYLQEARISSGDAAHDALVASRLSGRPRPRLEALIWRNRRIRAEAALRAKGVPLRVVTTSGRTRG